MTYSWGNEICTDNTEERAIVLATMNAMVNVIGTWLPLIVWQQIDAPEYHKGFVTASCLGGVAVIIVPIMKILQDRETARYVFLTPIRAGDWSILIQKAF